MQFNSPRFYPDLYTERESNDESYQINIKLIPAVFAQLRRIFVRVKGAQSLRPPKPVPMTGS
jgi:hypothetical protein